MSEGTLNRAYLALGSNIEPERNLPAAVSLLSAHGRVAAVSSVWESAPVGDVNQPNFLNGAILLETPLTAEQLKRSAIAEVESSLGRVRDAANRNAARTIDVDIALFNGDVLSVAGNEIPDPEILTRPFLAVPLAEIAPDYVHPTAGRMLGEIAKELGRDSLTLRVDVRLA